MEGRDSCLLRGPEGYVGLRAPKGSVYEGGVILLSTTPSLRVVTPVHHPTIFNPVGKALNDIMSKSPYGVHAWGTIFPQGNKARAIDSIRGRDTDELTFFSGQVITLTAKTRDTWFVSPFSPLRCSRYLGDLLQVQRRMRGKGGIISRQSCINNSG